MKRNYNDLADWIESVENELDMYGEKLISYNEGIIEALNNNSRERIKDVSEAMKVYHAA